MGNKTNLGVYEKINRAESPAIAHSKRQPGNPRHLSVLRPIALRPYLSISLPKIYSHLRRFLYILSHFVKIKSMI